MKKDIFILVLLCTLFVAFTACTKAAPVWGKKYNISQPSGDVVQVRIWGDEFYQIVESLDGYTLIRDPNTGIISYAQLSTDGKELISTGYAIGEIDPAALGLVKHIRPGKETILEKVYQAKEIIEQNKTPIDSQPTMMGVETEQADMGADFNPTTGNVKGLTLLVEFPDTEAEVTVNEVDNFCNQPNYTVNGNNGSVKDYYYDVSLGKLIYTNNVEGIYQAQNNKSYYDNPDEATGPKAAELILEALNWLENQGHDFSQYDSDGDGYIDAINCLYAGTPTGGWATGLWPHSGWISGQFEADGVKSRRYQITDMGNTLKLGTFVHENGHMLMDWPDLYDYTYDSYGIGDYCLMAYGGSSETNPVHPCAYLKITAGWVEPYELSVKDNGKAFTARRAGYGDGVGVYDVYKYARSEKEYFLIDTRLIADRDGGLSDSGLAIWHIDEDGSNAYQDFSSAGHYLVSLIQADNNRDLENKNNLGDGDDLYSGSDSFGPDTLPASRWWDGSPSRVTIDSNSTVNEAMEFVFNVGRKIVLPPLEENALVLNVNTDVNYPTIQQAIDEAADGDVLIANSEALYIESIDFLGKEITLRSGDVNDVNNTEVSPRSTYIYGNFNDTVVTFENGEGPNTVMDGFTIVGGLASKKSYNGTPDVSLGGGIYCMGASPTIRRCIIAENVALESGGGAFFDGSNSVISHCVFIYNLCGAAGGGIYCRAGEVTLQNCLIADNVALRPTAPEFGWGGGIASYEDANTTVINCTIANNVSTRLEDPNEFDSAGGIDCFLGNADLKNTIVWGNDGANSKGQLYAVDGLIKASYCDIQFGWGPNDVNAGYDANSFAVMDEDPLFADEFLSDYHLKSTGGRWDPYAYTNGDFDGDGRVRFGDFAIFAEDWLTSGENLRTDMVYDGFVDIEDLAEFVSHWLEYGVIAGDWVFVDNKTSPCIDAGDPADSYESETEDNGNRINMGAYGNTFAASKTPGRGVRTPDINLDRVVDWIDYSLFASMWMKRGQDYEADFDFSGFVDVADLKTFAEWWLIEVTN